MKRCTMLLSGSAFHLGRRRGETPRKQTWTVTPTKSKTVAEKQGPATHRGPTISAWPFSGNPSNWGSSLWLPRKKPQKEGTQLAHLTSNMLLVNFVSLLQPSPMSPTPTPPQDPNRPTLNGRINATCFQKDIKNSARPALYIRCGASQVPQLAINDKQNGKVRFSQTLTQRGPDQRATKPKPCLLASLNMYNTTAVPSPASSRLGEPLVSTCPNTC